MNQFFFILHHPNVFIYLFFMAQDAIFEFLAMLFSFLLFMNLSGVCCSCEDIFSSDTGKYE